MKEWIKIEDEFPQGEVLCTNGIVIGIGTVNEDYDCEEGNGVILCGISHWMPLPELPTKN